MRVKTLLFKGRMPTRRHSPLRWRTQRFIRTPLPTSSNKESRGWTRTTLSTHTCRYSRLKKLISDRGPQIRPKRRGHNWKCTLRLSRCLTPSPSSSLRSLWTPPSLLLGSKTPRLTVAIQKMRKLSKRQLPWKRPSFGTFNRTKACKKHLTIQKIKTRLASQRFMTRWTSTSSRFSTTGTTPT